MIFEQLFDTKSSTYTYIISSGKGREALIIDPVIEKTDQYTDQTFAIYNYFQKAFAYHQSSEKAIDLELSAMSGLFDGSKQLYVHANLVREITDAILFAAKYGFKNDT